MNEAARYDRKLVIDRRRSKKKPRDRMLGFGHDVSLSEIFAALFELELAGKSGRCRENFVKVF